MTPLLSSSSPVLLDEVPTAHLASTDSTESSVRAKSTTATNPLGRGLASAFLNKISDVETYCTAPGAFLSLLCKPPKFLLSAIPRWIGQKIQGGYDSESHGCGFVRYALGGCFVGLGNICGGAIGLVEGTVYFCLVGTVERSLRALFAFAAVLGGVIKSGCTFSREPLEASIKSAKKIISPNVTRMKYDESGEPDIDLVRKHLRYGAIAGATFIRPDGWTYAEYSTALVANNCEALKPEEIPKSVLARDEAEQTEHGSKLKLRVSNEGGLAPVYSSDAWSGLDVTFFKHAPPGGDPKYIINFARADNCGSGKTILSTALGIVDSGFDDADKLVKAFVEMYGKENVVVIGASKGGGLAQFAGMNNGTEVYAFNAMGLHTTHLRLLGPKLANKNKVTLINTMNDWLDKLLPVTPLSSVGNLYQIPGSERQGHLSFAFALTDYRNKLEEAAFKKSQNPTKENSTDQPQEDQPSPTRGAGTEHLLNIDSEKIESIIKAYKNYSKNSTG